MSNRDSLQDSIHDSQAQLQEDEQAGNSAGRPKSRKLPPVILPLALVALVLLGVKVGITDEKARQIEEELAASALDLFMESDASVLYYYAQYMELPPELPAGALQSIVDYQAIDESNYTLTIKYPPHNVPIKRDVTEINPPGDIETLLVP